MAYITEQDLKRLIQTDNVAQLTGSSAAVLNSAIETAITEAKSYLRAKYDIAVEFTDTPVFTYGTGYGYAARVYINADGYSGAVSYTVNQMAVQNGIVYRCTTNTTGSFNPAHWSAIGSQYALFYVKAPVSHAPFDVLTQYKVDDKVLYKGRKYTAKKASIVLSRSEALDYVNIENLPATNVLPDDPVNGAAYWTDNGLHTVTNFWPNNTDYWTAGDNRNQQIVNTCIDIALYHLHSRIAPHNIPDLRVKRYDDGIAWLRRCAKGEDITADIPMYQPRQGGRVQYGGGVKNEFIY